MEIGRIGTIDSERTIDVREREAARLQDVAQKLLARQPYSESIAAKIKGRFTGNKNQTKTVSFNSSAHRFSRDLVDSITKDEDSTFNGASTNTNLLLVPKRKGRGFTRINNMFVVSGDTTDFKSFENIVIKYGQKENGIFRPSFGIKFTGTISTPEEVVVRLPDEERTDYRSFRNSPSKDEINPLLQIFSTLNSLWEADQAKKSSQVVSGNE